MRLPAFAILLASTMGIFSANAQEKPQQVVPAISALGVMDDCLKLPTVGEILVCIAKARTTVVPLHFYTGEYTAYSEVDFGPRYDPRNYSGYGPIAADMCKRFAPHIKNPIINYTEFKSLSGGCCGYGFFVMSCAGID
jgi:hypothetical protein